MHMHKVFSANRAVLCLDGTHCSALSLHVCLRGPQFLFRLSCRADTPQTHRPTRTHKHNKQWRLSSSSFIPRPKNTHTRSHAHAPVHTQKQPFSEERKCYKICECYSSLRSPCLRQMDRDTIHLFDLLCEKHTSFTLCPLIGQLHVSLNHFLTWVSWCPHKFTDTLPTHRAWKEGSLTV